MKCSIEERIGDIQRNLFQIKKQVEQSMESDELIEKLSIDFICARKKHQLLHNALINIKIKPIDMDKLVSMHEDDEEEKSSSMTIEEKKEKFHQLKQLLTEQVKFFFDCFHQIFGCHSSKMISIINAIHSIIFER